MRRVEICLCLSLLGLPGSAWAQTSGSGNQATAEALFSEGRSLAAKGRYAEACSKFEASQQLDPGLGTVLNLADCYEKLGKTASAWAEYRNAIPLARAAGSKARLDLATSRAAALESHLSKVTIRVTSAVPGLEVKRDGALVLQAELDSALPVDPGSHTFEASAPGKRAWSTTVQVAADSPNVIVDVPALTDAPSDKAAAPVAAPASPPPKPEVPPTEHAGSTQRTVAITVGAVGVVGLGLGTVFGILAKNNLSDAKIACRTYPSGCDANAADLNSTASSQATISTVAFIAGGAALATGVVLWATAGSNANRGVALGIGPRGAFVNGSFQ